jgi:hypothetical protein
MECVPCQIALPWVTVTHLRCWQLQCAMLSSGQVKCALKLCRVELVAMVARQCAEGWGVRRHEGNAACCIDSNEPESSQLGMRLCCMPLLQ